MPPKENPERACEECIHFFACSKQCGVPMAQGSATGCECYETVKSSAAACLVERLTAENAALREKQRWISVTEKTPEYDMPQLALNADGDALIANYAYGEWFDTWGQDVEVTHWMPLPDAPEEGGKHE